MSDTKPRSTDVQKLQRAIVDGLEDVKGQNIVVFDTEQLSPLFERVIIASGTSNRQTKALASSVSDAVREAGFPKPRMEGQENGEWIIVDCGAAVAHVMQPAIRQYYNLEEIWGGKVVNMKPATAPKAVAASEPDAKAAKATKASAAGKTAKAAAGTKAAKVSKASKSADEAVADAPAKVKAPKAAAAKSAGKVPSKTASKTSSKVDSKATALPPEQPAEKKSAGKPGSKLSSKTVGTAAPAKAATSKSAPGKTTKTATSKTASDAKAAPVAKVKTLVVGKPSVKRVAKSAAGQAPARKVATRKKAS